MHVRHAAALLALTFAAAAHAEPKHIFWFGNSHTGWNGVPDFGQTGVIDLVSFIAVQGGYEAPVNFWFVQDGATMFDHARQSSRLTSRLPAGETWDHVVLQGHSEETVSQLGDVARFLFAAGAIDDVARATSPDVRTILYQTWAHAPGHGVYASQGGPVPDAHDYHAQVAGAYDALRDQITAEHGPGAAEVARVGDAFAGADWDMSLYRADRNHANARGALLAAMVLYGTIYEDQTLSDVLISFGGSTDLERRLADLGLTEDDWLELSALAESVLVPAPAPLTLAAAAGLLAARRRRPSKEVAS